MKCTKCNTANIGDFRIIRTDAMNKVVWLKCKCGNKFATSDLKALDVTW